MMKDGRRKLRLSHVLAWALAIGTIVFLVILCLFLLASINTITQMCIEKLGS